MENNENKELCQKCGGACCKRHPCQVFPCDLKVVNVYEVLNLLKSGYCFDYWEGKTKIYWIQPKVKGNDDLIQPLWSNGGSCIFLIDGIGCILTFEERPSQGKALVPSKVTCKLNGNYTKEDCKNAWIPYQDILKQAMEYHGKLKRRKLCIK